MKNVFAVAAALLFASTIFFGCGFVDDNPRAVEYDDEPKIESTYTGLYTTKVDTTGYEGGD